MFQLNITVKFLQSLVWLSGNPNDLALESISALFTDFTLCKIPKQRRSNVHCGGGLKSCDERVVLILCTRKKFSTYFHIL
jgi:hypothetical protein